MKLIILAFVISITLHILFFSSYKKMKDEYKEPQSTSKKVSKDKRKQQAVRYVRLMNKPSVKQVEVKPQEKVEKKLKEFKKVKKILPQKKTVKAKKTRKILPKKAKKIVKKTTYTKPKQIKPQRKRQTIKNKSLENFFLSEPVPLDMELLDNMTRKYLKVYGKEYNSFTNVQKVFLQNNLGKFQIITQKVLNRLGYPELARKRRLSGTNVVEFIFHPNGDISNLRLTANSKYEVFDKHTLELIEIAYKDYPRPKSPTKIKFFVTYTSR